MITKFLKPALCCLLCISFFPENILAQQASERPVVAVLDFEAENVTRSEVQEYTDYLSYTLRQINEYRVIDREQREQILREREFGREERADEIYEKRIGAEIDADLIVIGKIQAGEDGYALEAKLIEIERSRILNQVSRVYADSQELFDDCQMLIRELFREKINTPWIYQFTLGVGVLSGLGFLKDEPDNSFSAHIPLGVYTEYIYPRGTVFIYAYYGFIRKLMFVELSYGYRINLFERMKFIPFVGLSAFAGTDPKDDEATVWIALNAGINLEFLLHRKSGWKLNIRANYSLSFYDGERWFKRPSDALLYFIISTGYTLLGSESGQ